MRHWAEAVVRDHLVGRGWRLLDANAVVRGGELDLVMRDGPVTVAVEVRQRATSRYGSPAESLRPGKLRRLRRALRLWAVRQYGRDDVPLRIDAVLVLGTEAHHRIEHLEDVA